MFDLLSRIRDNRRYNVFVDTPLGVRRQQVTKNGRLVYADTPVKIKRKDIPTA